MGEKPKHPKNVAGYEDSFEMLAWTIGNLSYDSLAKFIEELAKDIQRQGEKDQERKRLKLSKKLLSAAKKLQEAKEEIAGAWKICEPFM
ncbi:MAG: hypothetical protein WC523_01810 [Patescibacteria group bacterium]|jgi:hypothetical protein